MVGTPGSYYLSRPEWDFGIEQREPSGHLRQLSGRGPIRQLAAQRTRKRRIPKPVPIRSPMDRLFASRVPVTGFPPRTNGKFIVNHYEIHIS